MRRALIAATALVTSVALLGGPAAGAQPSTPAPAPASGEAAAERALDVALELFDGDGAPSAESAGAEEVSASLALRDLWRFRDALDGRDRARADSLLARPTDGTGRNGDQFGNGYEDGADTRQECLEDVCVTWVMNTDDSADPAFARRTLAVMQDVHGHHVDELGWRPPEPDGGSEREGGNPKFDVYLADVGAQGLYGYCAPDDGTRATTKVTDGYCVLDNDYTDRVFPNRNPDENLRVTAAHEYLHAIQYAYDATEDPWLFEATATWIEERYADEVDDNRQYLAASQLRRPDRPLDRFTFGARASYGNWIFFEHLANRFGPEIVETVWDRAAADGAPDRTSVAAVASALASEDTDLPTAYALFAADNTVPGRSRFYPEGGEWGLKAPMTRSATLDRGKRTTGRWTLGVDHLASKTVAIRSRGLVDGNRLRIVLDGPAATSGQSAYAVVHRRDGSIVRRYVPLGSSGTRTLRFDFASARIDRVTLTSVNASPRGDRRQFAVVARVARGS